MNTQKSGIRRKVRPKKKKGVFGTLLLWLVMLALVGAVVAEFHGPYKGWFVPVAERAERDTRALIEKMRPRPEEDHALVDHSKDDTGENAEPDPLTSEEPDPLTSEEPENEAPLQVASVQPAPITRPLPKIEPAKTTPPKNMTTTETVRTPRPPPPADTQKQGKNAAAEPEKIDYRELFTRFMEEELARLPMPKAGRVYTVPTTQYDILIGRAPVYTGTLMVINDDRVVLRRTDNGESVIITPDLLSPQWLATLFPKIIARRRAVARLDKVMGEYKQTSSALAVAPPPQLSPPEKRKEQTVAMPTQPTQPPVTKPPPTKPPPRGKLTEYDTSQAKTPKELGNEVQMFGQWLQMQSQRAGGQLAKELYAKKQGRDVVLYLVMHSNFTNQRQNLRESVAESFWNMWAHRCRESGAVSNLQNAHVVLLDDNRNIIGGSRVNSASDIWAKR